MLFYMLTRNVAYIFETNKMPIVSSVMAVIVYIVMVFIFRYDQILYTFSTGVMIYFTMFFEFALPAIVLIIAIIKKIIYNIQQKKQQNTEIKNET